MAAGFEDFAHHNALADAEACAAIIVHAAKRHGAADITELAELSGSKIGTIGAPMSAPVDEVAGSVHGIVARR
jgi:DNA polymerase-3 subunit epsilon